MKLTINRHDKNPLLGADNIDRRSIITIMPLCTESYNPDLKTMGIKETNINTITPISKAMTILSLLL